MAETYYPQSDHRPATMTVGELIAKLSEHDPSSPVIFRSPLSGCYGPNTGYSVDVVKAETLEHREVHYPAGTDINEETGEEFATEPWTDVFHAWSGVVIG